MRREEGVGTYNVLDNKALVLEFLLHRTDEYLKPLFHQDISALASNSVRVQFTLVTPYLYHAEPVMDRRCEIDDLFRFFRIQPG